MSDKTFNLELTGAQFTGLLEVLFTPEVRQQVANCDEQTDSVKLWRVVLKQWLEKVASEMKPYMPNHYIDENGVKHITKL